MSIPRHKRALAIVAGLSFVIMACVVQGPEPRAELHRWWAGLGPVLPHESFPADCSLCHVGQEWNTLNRGVRRSTTKVETGFELVGAHERAQCLRCHNDRGPVATFQAKGCIGCHEDVHYGELRLTTARSCHNQRNWWPDPGMVEHAQQALASR